MKILSFIESLWVLGRLIESHWVSLSLIESHWVSLSLIESHWVSLSLIKSNWVQKYQICCYLSELVLSLSTSMIRLKKNQEIIQSYLTIIPNPFGWIDFVFMTTGVHFDLLSHVIYFVGSVFRLHGDCCGLLFISQPRKWSLS